MKKRSIIFLCIVINFFSLQNPLFAKRRASSMKVIRGTLSVKNGNLFINDTLLNKNRNSGLYRLYNRGKLNKVIKFKTPVVRYFEKELPPKANLKAEADKNKPTKTVVTLHEESANKIKNTNEQDNHNMPPPLPPRPTKKSNDQKDHGMQLNDRLVEIDKSGHDLKMVAEKEEKQDGLFEEIKKGVKLKPVEQKEKFNKKPDNLERQLLAARRKSIQGDDDYFDRIPEAQSEGKVDGVSLKNKSNKNQFLAFNKSDSPSPVANRPSVFDQIKKGTKLKPIEQKAKPIAPVSAFEQNILKHKENKNHANDIHENNDDSDWV